MNKIYFVCNFIKASMILNVITIFKLIYVHNWLRSVNPNQDTSIPSVNNLLFFKALKINSLIFNNNNTWLFVSNTWNVHSCVGWIIFEFKYWKKVIDIYYQFSDRKIDVRKGEKRWIILCSNMSRIKNSNNNIYEKRNVL